MGMTILYPYFSEHPRDIIIANHPRLSKFRSNLKKSKVSSQIKAYFLNNIGFIYPNIISLSIILTSENCMLFAQHEKVIREFEELKQIIKRNGLNKILLNVIGSDLFDPIILEILQMFVPEEGQGDNFFGFIAAEPIKNYLMRIQPEDDDILQYRHDSIEQFIIEARAKVFKEDTNRQKLMLSGPLDLNQTEAQIRIMRNSLRGKKSFDILYLDLTNAISFDLISVNLLLVFLHTLAHNYGCMFRIKFPLNKSAYRSLIDLRLPSLLHPYLFVVDERIVKDINNREKFDELYGPRFGIKCFDAKNESEVHKCFLKSFRDCLGARGEYFKNLFRLIGEKTTMLVWQDIITMLRLLCDNVIRHSESVGYLSFEFDLTEKILQLVVADVGIGLKKGLKKNYNMKIKDHQDAISRTLDLPKYKRFRKNNALGGFGLAEVRDIIFRLNGIYAIRTGNCGMTFRRSKKRKGKIVLRGQSDLFFISGVQFFIRIPV